MRTIGIRQQNDRGAPVSNNDRDRKATWCFRQKMQQDVQDFIELLNN
jgi:hypothetical protein